MDTPQLEVILTGTGTPRLSPGRAGPGVLVRYGEVELQFDAGRSTGLRLAEAGTGPGRLAAVFLTHHHSDHMVDLADLAMTAWINLQEPPMIVAPEGPAARFARGLLDPWAEELELRCEHGRRTAPPTVAVATFEASTTPAEVWSRGEVRVTAVSVRHEPVEPAVAFRVDTPSGSVVISGDTKVCAEVEELSRGADVLVHEACRRGELADTPWAFAVAYHADTVELGTMAARVGVPTLMLTHLIPSPVSEEEEAAFATDVRSGGYEGDVIVGRDLATATSKAPASVD